MDLPEGLIPKMDGRVLPVISNIIVTRKLNDDELNLIILKHFHPSLILKTFCIIIENCQIIEFCLELEEI